MIPIIAGSVLALGGTVLLAPVIGTAVLGAAGFGASGVVAGSFAAAAQSAIYGPLTCGVFSALQAAGATAAAPAVGTVVAGGASLAAAVGVALL